MSGLYLYDDARAREFEPFALTRPVSDMVAGTVPQRARWQTVLQMPVAGVIPSAHLADFDEVASGPSARGRIPAGSVIANARFAPRLSTVHRFAPNDNSESTADLWLSGGRVVAARTARELAPDYFSDGRRAIDDLGRSGVET
ncbi:MAG: hypothetical protein DMD26_01195, partial [Gemmatimonadetes bacterium]